MAPGRNTKRARFQAIFAQAASVLADGNRAVLRPESADDHATVKNYWYIWRKIYWGVGSKSDDPEVRRKAAIVLDSRIRVDTDNNGRVILVIEPYITPKVQAIIEQIVDTPRTSVALSTGQGSSAPSATKSEADHFLAHTRPWRDWFAAQGGGTEAMFKCLDTIPRDMRANPDLAALDDLPAPNEAEGVTWKARFATLLKGEQNA